MSQVETRFIYTPGKLIVFQVISELDRTFNFQQAAKMMKKGLNCYIDVYFTSNEFLANVEQTQQISILLVQKDVTIIGNIL